eukprot:1324714-Amorphochlora_amoeboformis.AAC.1
MQLDDIEIKREQNHAQRYASDRRSSWRLSDIVYPVQETAGGRSAAAGTLRAIGAGSRGPRAIRRRRQQGPGAGGDNLAPTTLVETVV